MRNKNSKRQLENGKQGEENGRSGQCERENEPNENGIKTVDDFVDSRDREREREGARKGAQAEEEERQREASLVGFISAALEVGTG